jgi:hypothetical protein
MLIVISLADLLSFTEASKSPNNAQPRPFFGEQLSIISSLTTSHSAI